MRRSEARTRWRPVRMARVAVAAPLSRMREVLAQVGDAGCVEFEGGPDLKAFADAAVVRDGVAALPGWMPEPAVAALADRLAPLGGAVMPLPHPRGVQAPSLLRPGGVRGSINMLVETYGAVPYADVDPAPLAMAAYMLMFGMMFGDAGHGLLLLALAGLLLSGRLPRLRRMWPFAAGAGVTSVLFGLLYGEFFGPTGWVPVLWLEPMAEPIPLLLAALGVGGLLLGGAYLLGSVNRWREGGWPLALYARSGVAGAAAFLGVGLVAAGWYTGLGWLLGGGIAVAVAGLGLVLAGFVAEGGGVTQAVMELFDVVVSLGSNVASFARLAAFGLTHAAIGAIVWENTAGLWPSPAAVVVFLLGNAVAFALEGLVVAIQALRLEYYELFSRVFETEGRPFRPWHVPLEGSACPSGSSEVSSPSLPSSSSSLSRS
ncbi:V-type ATPase 116kDa subunit family protein [Nonomuraea sp. NPDC048826]|uniref:V-type ATPase 116kDa subunit family protein n=1 Tax=Nonomuraea sp. NPDC048826 TaxID=3364347 RepID=UPI00372351CE